MRVIDAFALFAATGMTAPASPPAGLDGVWGGPGTILTVDASGGVVQQDCAAGRFGPLKANKSGSFKTRGTWEDYQPGPQRADAPAATMQARFEGRITGDTLTLTIARAGLPAQTLTLLKNKRAKLIRCL